VEEVDQYKLVTTSSTAHTIEQYIVNEYIRENGRRQLNLSQSMRESVVKKHEQQQRVVVDHNDLSLFDEVIQTSHQQLKQEKFPLFIASDMFYSFIQKKQGISEEVTNNVDLRRQQKSPRLQLYQLKRMSVRLTGILSTTRKSIYPTNEDDSEITSTTATSSSCNSSKNNTPRVTSYGAYHHQNNSTLMKTFSLDELRNLTTNTMTRNQQSKSLPATHQIQLQIPPLIEDNNHNQQQQQQKKSSQKRSLKQLLSKIIK
jgi:hypothetical protein